MQLVQRFQLFQLVHFNWLNHMVGILRAIGMQEAFGIFEMSAHMIPGLGTPVPDAAAPVPGPRRAAAVRVTGLVG